MSEKRYSEEEIEEFITRRPTYPFLNGPDRKTVDIIRQLLGELREAREENKQLWQSLLDAREHEEDLQSQLQEAAESKAKEALTGREG